MCEWSHIYDESERSLMISLIRLLGFPYEQSAGRSFRKMRCLCHFFAWTTCCSNQQSPNEAKFRDGSFDHWDVDQGIYAGRKIHHVCSLTLRTKWFEKSTDVCPIVRNGNWSPQWWGAQRRRQDTVHKSFVNSTEVVFAAIPPCSTTGITCNQVNVRRIHDGTESEDELLRLLADNEIWHVKEHLVRPILVLLP